MNKEKGLPFFRAIKNCCLYEYSRYLKSRAHNVLFNCTYVVPSNYMASTHILWKWLVRLKSSKVQVIFEL